MGLKSFWSRRYVRPAFIIVLAAIAMLEGVLLYEQKVSSRTVRANSDRLLRAFMQGDTAKTVSRTGVRIGLQNVRFEWSPKVYIDTRGMAVEAVAMQGRTVNFDDPGSFVMKLQRSTVLLSTSVLEGMLNESIFNYPGSKLRNLKATLVKSEEGTLLRLAGNVDIVVWIPFTMDARLSVDHATNTLVMEVEKLKILKVVPATRLVKWTPFHLSRLIPSPPNGSLFINGNRILIKPFALFPPPRITGTVASVAVDPEGIRLQFAGEAIPAPKSTAKNYVYLRGGNAQFGQFQMLDTNILIVDRDESTPFRFSLLHYSSLIPKSDVEVHDMGSVLVKMPDYSG
jgi:hypothetical protein